jgi:S-disulfanyl-L-cysteine oxidoreductase SoxD
MGVSTMSMRNGMVQMAGGLALIVGLLTAGAWAADGPGYRGPFGFGSVPSAADIQARDIAVGPNGAGLPAGRGTVSAGERVYQAKCVSCHGPTGTEGPMDKLVGEKLPVKTIGSFWPYATTVFDYIRRAQPFNQPGSLTDDEVYALTAWLLFRNQIIAAEQVINAETLPNVRMPNRDGFVPDPRPDVD